MVKLGVNEGIIKDFYDARYGGNYMQEHGGLDLHRVKTVLDEIPIAARFILDYGCGQGGWTDTISRKFPEAELCGIDISAKAITLAAKRHPEHKFLVFDGETAPMADASFDLIYSYHVLEHVFDVEKTVFDISRLLKKGGYLCIVLPCGNVNSFEEKITRLVKKGREISIDGRERFFYDDAGHIRRLKSGELIELFARNNLKIYKELYAYQFWGAMEWISKSSPVVINEIFNNKMGAGLSAKTKLLFFRMLFLLLAGPMKLYTANLPAQIKSGRGRAKKMLFLALIPAKILVIPLGGAIDLLSFLEWHFLRAAKNGSAQYLVFKK